MILFAFKKKIASKSLYVTGDIKGGKALKNFIESGRLFTESLGLNLISIFRCLNCEFRIAPLY